MIAPPANPHLGRHGKDCDMWVEYQYMQSLLDPQDIVEDCEGMYEDTYGGVSKQDRNGLVLSDLQQDLVKMSIQPAIGYVYRRFVVIKSNEDVHGRSGEEDWVSSQGAEFPVRAANLSAIPSASGSRFQSSSLVMKLKLMARITGGVYDRCIMCIIECSGLWKGRFSRILVREKSRGRHLVPLPNSIPPPVVLNNGPALSLTVLSLSPLLARLFAGRTTIDTPLNHGPPATDPVPEPATLRLSLNSITHRRQGQLR